MEFYDLFGVVGILRESIRLLPKNGKLMSLVTLLLISISSIFIKVFHSAFNSLLQHMLLKAMTFPISGTDSYEYIALLATLRQDFAFYLFTSVAFFLCLSLVSLFSTTAIVLLSAVSYTDKTLSVKTLFVRVLKTWARPLVTAFYTMLLSAGYFVVVLLLASPSLMYSDRRILSVSICIGTFTSIVYLYLSVVWILAEVISVIEENCFGIEALGEAGRLVKGKRLHGFVLNVVFNLTVAVIFQGVRIVTGHRWGQNPTALTLFTMTLVGLLKVMNLSAFTVLYFHCKKNQGEEIELQGGSVDSVYGKIIDDQKVDDVLLLPPGKV